MEKNSRHKNCLRRGMAAFCLSAVLSAGSFSFTVPVYAEEYGTLEEAIPESVTIEAGCCLGDVGLPDSAFGSLSWAYPDYVPQEYVEECTAWLYPADPDQVNWMDGWDSDEGALKVMITVVLHEQESYDEWTDESGTGDDVSQEDYEESLPETASSPDEEESFPPSDETPEAGYTGMIVEEGGLTEDPAVNEGSGVPADTENPTEGSETGAEEPAGTTEGQAGTAEEAAGTPEGQAGTAEEAAGTPEGQTETSGQPENTETTDEPEQPDNTEPAPSIFDTDLADSDDRTGDAGDPAGMTEQQILDAAARNHLSNGIYVSGPNLPWYVMFTATEDNEHSFSIASGAKVFKAFRFELWDLQANKPYTIPDGDYVSVTIPVTAGYNYTVEHLLNSGATETIVPSVNGSSLVFSTNSFSSYGIAGSETVVGGEITDENYNNPPKNDQSQPTPVPTQAPAQQQTVTNTPAPQQTTQNAEQPPVVSQGVRTGDDTNITPMVVLVICAAAVIIAAVILLLIKRRKK